MSDTLFELSVSIKYVSTNKQKILFIVYTLYMKNLEINSYFLLSYICSYDAFYTFYALIMKYWVTL